MIDMGDESYICCCRKNVVEEKSTKKRVMSKPGHPVLVTGATTEPAFNGVPVNMSSDDKELVMEYSGN